MSESFYDETSPLSTVEEPSESLARSIILKAQFENLDWVREFVSNAGEECGLKPSAIYAVQLAVDEAFSNVVEHAYGGECLEEVQCTCQITDQALIVTLRDCGHPFDPQKVPNPDLNTDLQRRRVGGLGLYFMRQLMDEVDFTFDTDPRTGKQCNILRMVKRKED